MSEIAKYEAYKKKLQGVCDENELVFRFKNDSYPITLTIRPVNGLEQMSLLESEEKEQSSPDAAMVFAYKDGVLTYKISESFAISDVLFSKIKNLYKNMHAMWLQFFNREVIEKSLLTGEKLPKASEDDSSGYDDDLEAEDVGNPEPLENTDDTDVTDDDYGLENDDDDEGGDDSDDEA
ncbi:MAG: hypothetical protein K0R50_428 [Eubacterium sp.]|jgi:hypothetical protein|nr:hypothetical protein [Eubacterium sp.]